jgi:hypothetical protein
MTTSTLLTPRKFLNCLKRLNAVNILPEQFTIVVTDWTVLSSYSVRNPTRTGYAG